MESAFAWLNKLFDYLWQFVPRLYLVIWTCRSVKYRRGKMPFLEKPGVHWYWPVTTMVKIINIMVRAQEFLPTAYTTRDSRRLQFRLE